ncbi:MAG: transcription termination factor NusA [Patescibacteria group bacterium]|jgi:N utilization substance protein A
MATEFELAIEQICEEKNLKKEDVISTIEAALAAAFRKDYGKKGQLIETEFDPKTGKTLVFDVKEVVEEKEEEDKAERQVTVEEGQKLKKGAKVGDIIKTEITPKEISFGRIAAQTAKQVIIQKIREAERNTIFDAYKDKEGEVLNGTIQRMEGQTMFVDLGQATGLLFPTEQIRGEEYSIGQRLKVFLVEVKESAKGPEIILSRSHPDIVRRMFELEVPEIAAGAVVIKAVAREAGARTKIAVMSTKEEIDPIGACVGQRGTRVQTIINELGGEKIDIISWDENPVKFITNALSPAKAISVQLNEEEKTAKVEVVEDQLSLAIGKHGQNVRLAVKLTGWKIDVLKDESSGNDEKTDDKTKAEEKKDVKTENSKEKTEKTDKKPEAKEEKVETKKEESKKEDKSEKKEKAEKK